MGVQWLISLLMLDWSFHLYSVSKGDEEWYGTTLSLESEWINYTSLKSNLLERREVSGLYNFVKRWAEGDFTDVEISFMEFELVLKYEPALMSRLWTVFFGTARCHYPEKFSKPGFQPKMA